MKKSTAHYYQTDAGIGRGLESFSLKTILLREAARKQKKGLVRLLEIGSGKGRLLLDLLQRFPDFELYGLNKDQKHGLRDRSDFRHNAVGWGLKLPNNVELPFLHIGDGTELPFQKNTFDLVVSQVTFLHIENKARALEEVCRILKPGGVALIGIGPYSIRRQRGHAMPEFFQTLRKNVGKDLNPRFLIRENEQYQPFTALSSFMNIPGYSVKLHTHEFTSPTQRARGFWLMIEKKEDVPMKLPLQYRARESKTLTQRYQRLNPVNWGCIDVYDVTNT